MNLDEVIAAILRGFRRVADFSGRDARGQFWPYALFVYLAGSALAMTALLPSLFSSVTGMVARMDQMARENPDDWVVHRSATGIEISYVGDDPAVMQALMPDMRWFLPVIGLFTIIMVVLLAAALARRLHDRGRSGWWLIVPLALTAGSFVAMARLFPALATPAADPAVATQMLHDFGLLMVANVAGLICQLILLLQLLLSGSAGANRFGPPPSLAVDT